MEKRIELRVRELDEVTFTCRLISSQQDYMSIDVEAMLEEGCYCVFSRLDMFWIECHLGDTNLGPFCVVPNLDDSNLFTISTNHNKVIGSKLYERAAAWFLNQPEYQQQRQWIQAIIDKCFAPVGGREEWERLSRIARKRFEDHKISVAKKYASMFESVINKLTDWRLLDVHLQQENVYRVTPWRVSTYGHMEYIYKEKVRGKPLVELPIEIVSGVFHYGKTNPIFTCVGVDYPIVNCDDQYEEYDCHNAKAIIVGQSCVLTAIF